MGGESEWPVCLYRSTFPLESHKPLSSREKKSPDRGRGERRMSEGEVVGRCTRV